VSLFSSCRAHDCRVSCVSARDTRQPCTRQELKSSILDTTTTRGCREKVYFRYIWFIYLLHNCKRHTTDKQETYKQNVSKIELSSAADNVGHYIVSYGVATISRLLKIIGLSCRISPLLYGSLAKETYNFKEPTNRSHPVRHLLCHARQSCRRDIHIYII